MRNNNSKLAFDQACGWATVLGATKTNITHVSHNSHLSEDGDLILIRFHEGPLLIQLIVPQDAMELCPPWSLLALCKLYFLLLWLHSSPAPWMLNGAHDSGDTLCASWWSYYFSWPCVLEKFLHLCIYLLESFFLFFLLSCFLFWVRIWAMMCWWACL